MLKAQLIQKRGGGVFPVKHAVASHRVEANLRLLRIHTSHDATSQAILYEVVLSS